MNLDYHFHLNKDNNIIQIGNVPIRIDILTDIDGVEFYGAYKSKVMQNFDGLLVPVLHIDDILKNKMSTGRAKDKIDVEELKKLLK